MQGKQLAGQTIVFIGGSAGIGLATARLARIENANVILTGRDPKRLNDAARDVHAWRTAAFDVHDDDAVREFFQGIPGAINHIMVTAGNPRYGPMLQMGPGQLRETLSGHIMDYHSVARHAASKIEPKGSLVFMGGTGGRRVTKELGIIAAVTAALPPFTSALALELAPIRVNLIAAGFVDTPLSASLLGERLEDRRAHLRATLPIGRVVGAMDVAALAIHLMTNTALTGATYDIDGGQQFSDP